MSIAKQISLYYKQGTSDKVYHAQLVQGINGYRVFFQYGRRGSTLTQGEKTNNEVSWENAFSIYSKLVSSKKAKGYTEGEAGTQYVGNELVTSGGVSVEERKTDLHCQLLNKIEEEDLEDYFTDDDFVAQEKYDGKRITLHGNEDKIRGINKLGLVCGIPETFAQTLTKIIGKSDKALQAFGLHPIYDIILDGEAVGDKYYAFDCRQINQGESLVDEPYQTRHGKLFELLQQSEGENIIMVKTAITEAAKRALYDEIKARRGEGIVFKRKDAPYTVGRPNKGGNQLKYKFYAEATCQVLTVSQTKRSFSVGVTDDNDKIVSVGNVTIPANKPFPKVGEMVEIKYLNIMKGGSLYQPFFKEIRDDKLIPDKYNTLKFKADGTDDE